MSQINRSGKHSNVERQKILPLYIKLPKLQSNWAFINDVTQLEGEGGLHFCDKGFKGSSKKGILTLQSGERVIKSSNLRDVPYEQP